MAPIPNATDTMDFYNMFKFVNDQATGGLFFPVTLLVVWVIAFIGALADGRQASRGWTFASFISIILGSLLVLMDLMNRNYVLLLVLFLAFGLVWMKLQEAPLN